MAADPEYWHNKGEQDYPDNYDPPINELEGYLTMYDDDDIENMKAYKAGWENARKQVGR
jgi:hypothetical protein